MSIGINKELKKDSRMMRAVYCETLMELAEKDSRVVSLDADLMNSMGMKPFQKKFPERTFNCGVQEADMIGIAAGLSATGQGAVRTYLRAVRKPSDALTRYSSRRRTRSSTCVSSAAIRGSRRRSTAARTCRLRTWRCCARSPARRYWSLRTA